MADMKCRGGVCDKGCIWVCEYKSSADEAREVMAKADNVFPAPFAPEALENFDTHGSTKEWRRCPVTVTATGERCVYSDLHEGDCSHGCTRALSPREWAALKIEQTMPKTSADRKAIPLCSGVLDYFPAALAEVAKLSKAGNDKHNPGQPLHWARGKSMDHADCLARHLVDRGVIDPDSGLSHTVEVAWRALAMLQEECEAKGAPVSRGSK